jgi:hypothetical protein
MTTDQDWRELIDSSFGDGPGHPPMTDRLVAGRRALRVRRVVMGAATAVAVTVVGGTAWATFPSDTSTGTPVVDNRDRQVHHPDGDTQVSTTSGELLVRWDGSQWQVEPGWTVITRIDNPMEYEPPKRSVAMELRSPSDEHEFALATYDGPSSSGVTHMPIPPGTTLEEWIPAQVDNLRQLDGEPAPEPVRFGQGETLVPAEGVTILDEVPHPDLPANFAAPDDRTAAASIEVNGKERFVLVRELGRREEIIPFTGSFASLEKFLQYAQQQYAGGGGIR